MKKYLTSREKERKHYLRRFRWRLPKDSKPDSKIHFSKDINKLNKNGIKISNKIEDSNDSGTVVLWEHLHQITVH